MSPFPRSFLSTGQLSDQQLQQFFRDVVSLKDRAARGPWFQNSVLERASSRVGLSVFLEPSTRTRTSFAISAQRLGLSWTLFDHGGSSLAKGESPTDTFLNLVAMGPDLLVIRHGDDPNLERAVRECPIPVISAGQGRVGHPTQALLDVLTILERKRSVGTLSLAGLKVLFVGDVRHGRAALSTMELCHRLGADLASCGPLSMAYEGPMTSHHFPKLLDGAKWADVVVGLRVQAERHTPLSGETPWTADQYRESFCLNRKSLEPFRPDGLIMHPGPFVPGLDFDPELLTDSRCVIHEQVKNGVYVRASLMLRMLNLDGEGRS
jgi:aspartate carbamoyltransferase catalytic subunit